MKRRVNGRNKLPSKGDAFYSKSRHLEPNPIRVVQDVIPQTDPDTGLEDYRVILKNVGGDGRTSRVWYTKTFRYQSNFWPVDAPTDAVKPDPASSASVEDAEAIRSILIRIAEAAEALVMLWSGKPMVK